VNSLPNNIQKPMLKTSNLCGIAAIKTGYIVANNYFTLSVVAAKKSLGGLL